MIDFATLTLVDYGIVFVLVLSIIMSIMRGITREILGLAGWGISIIIANYSAPIIEDPIIDLLQVRGLGAALAWGLPFAASVVIWFILASLIAPSLKRVGLGSLDRWLGILFGIVRGYGLILIVFVAAVFAAEGESNLPATIKQSQSTPLLSRSAHYFSGFVPEDYREQLFDYLLYKAPLIVEGVTIEPTLTDEVISKSDAVNGTGKQTDANGITLLSDEKVK